MSLSSHRQCTEYIQSKLSVTCDGISREVTHFHFTGWPDFGTPRTPAGFTELVRSVGESGGRGVGPILVHCSAGLGRSGVFIAVHSSLETHAREERHVDLETTVCNMRQQRGGMVQTSEQYRFCFEAVAEALDPILPPVVEEISQPSGRSKMFTKTSSLPVTEEPPLIPSRPVSQPLLDREGTSQRRARKRYLQDSIPPPPTSDPPSLESDKEDKMASIRKRISSPPPPSSSPPPPLTPSNSLENTPKKFPYPETSPEATPPKHPVDKTQPDIFVTPPTRHTSHSSISQDIGSINHKIAQKEMKKTYEESSKDKKDSERTTTVASSVTGIVKVKPKHSPQDSSRDDRTKQSSPPLTIKGANAAVREDVKDQVMSEEELTKTLEGFEVPPPTKNGTDTQLDVVGFEIGDNQVLEVGPPPKMEVMKKVGTQVTSKWGGRGSAFVKKETQSPSSSLSTSGTKPQKWGQILTSHTQKSIPPPVNRDADELDRKVDRVQKVGKLVIPGVFGGTTVSTSPPSPLRKPVKPVSQPVVPVQQPVKPVSQPVKPVSEAVKPAETTPPVLRIIRQMETSKQKTGTTPQPTNKIASPFKAHQPTTPSIQPPKPVTQQEKPVKRESPPPAAATNVKALLARFENKT